MDLSSILTFTSKLADTFITHFESGAADAAGVGQRARYLSAVFKNAAVDRVRSLPVGMVATAKSRMIFTLGNPTNVSKAM